MCIRIGKHAMITCADGVFGVTDGEREHNWNLKKQFRQNIYNVLNLTNNLHWHIYYRLEMHKNFWQTQWFFSWMCDTLILFFIVEFNLFLVGQPLSSSMEKASCNAGLSQGKTYMYLQMGCIQDVSVAHIYCMRWICLENPVYMLMG